MSGMAFRIATLKKLWKKEGVNVDHATLNRWVIPWHMSIIVANPARINKRLILVKPA
jgi:transposase-like protein